MYPRLGGFENLDGALLYTPVTALAALAVSLVLFWLLGREGFRIRDLVPMAVLVGIGGFGGAKLYSLLYRWVSFGGTLGDFSQEVQGGWRYPGALVGMLLAVWLGRRLLPRGLSARAYLDAWAPAFAFGGGIGRVACLLHGCCYGAPTSLPWAIQYPYGSIPWHDHLSAGHISRVESLSAAVHPFPVYLLLMEWILAVYLLRLRKRARFEGEVTLHFLAIHGLAKGWLELFRDPVSGFHLVVVPIGLVALAVLLWERRLSFADERAGAAGVGVS